MYKYNFIINVDDFGMNDSINQACISLNKLKKINSISVIMNYQDQYKIKKYLKRYNGKIGLHLNWTENKPTIKKLKTKFYNQGCFQGYKKILASYIFGKLNYDDLYKEAENQLRMLKKISPKIDHIDGHQHIHMLPILWRVVNDLASKYKIPRVRHPIEKIYWGDQFSLIFKKIIFYFLSFFNKKYYNLRYFNFFGHSLQNSKNYKKIIISKLKENNKYSEIMIHVSKKKDLIKKEKIKFGRLREYLIIKQLNYTLK